MSGCIYFLRLLPALSLLAQKEKYFSFLLLLLLKYLETTGEQAATDGVLASGTAQQC